MNSIDAAWVAGIVEGEGSMGLDNMGPKSGNRHPKAHIKVAMTDEDVVRALHSKTGVGNVFGPYPGGGTKGNPEWKEQWVWHVAKREDVRSIITAILPFLYERRTVQAMTCLDVMDRLDEAAIYRKNFCSNGHARTDDNKFSNGRCIACSHQRYRDSKLEVS